MIQFLWLYNSELLLERTAHSHTHSLPATHSPIHYTIQRAPAPVHSRESHLIPELEWQSLLHSTSPPVLWRVCPKKSINIASDSDSYGPLLLSVRPSAPSDSNISPGWMWRRRMMKIIREENRSSAHLLLISILSAFVDIVRMLCCVDTCPALYNPPTDRYH